MREADEEEQGPQGLRRSIKLRISYKLNVAATVRFTLQATSSGRKLKGKCVKQTDKNRKHHVKCTITKKVSGSLTQAGTAGANTFTFTGKIAGRALAPGSYVLTATPTGGVPHGVRFTLLA